MLGATVRQFVDLGWSFPLTSRSEFSQLSQGCLSLLSMHILQVCHCLITFGFTSSFARTTHEKWIQASHCFYWGKTKFMQRTCYKHNSFVSQEQSFHKDTNKYSQLLFWNRHIYFTDGCFIPLHPFPAANLLPYTGTSSPATLLCDSNKRLNESIMTTTCSPNYSHLFTKVHGDLLHLQRKLPLITSCIRLQLNYCSHSTRLMFYSNSN